MKKFILLTIIFCISASITSCNEQNTSTTAKPQFITSIDTTNPDDITITLYIPRGVHSKTNIDYLQPNSVKKNLKASKQYTRDIYPDINTWYDYIAQNYGIELKINYISPIYNTLISSGSYYINAIEEGYLSGLLKVEYGNYDSMAHLQASGYIVPLDQYLIDSLVYSIWPEEMKASGKFPDGQTWFLPAGYNQHLYGRFYNSEWLDALNITQPVGLNELYGTAKAFADSDLNKNNVKDEVAIGAMVYDGPKSFGDVFIGNECFLMNEFSTSISYDPKTGAYEDATLKPGMVNALQYIKQLIDENLVEFYSSYKFLDTNYVGMAYGKDDLLSGNSGFEFQYSLFPEEEYSAMGVGPDSYYALAFGTKNPSHVINGFLNTFYGSTNGMLSGMYGVEGDTYTVKDSVLEIKDGPYINVVDNMPYLSDYDFNDIKQTIPNTSLIYSYYGSELSVFPNNYTASYYNKYYEIYTSLYNQKQLVVDNIYFPAAADKKISDAFSRYFVYYFSGMFENLGIQDFLSAYTSEMKKCGAQTILDDLNYQAGTKAKYRYGN